MFILLTISPPFIQVPEYFLSSLCAYTHGCRQKHHNFLFWPTPSWYWDVDAIRKLVSTWKTIFTCKKRTHCFFLAFLFAFSMNFFIHFLFFPVCNLRFFNFFFFLLFAFVSVIFLCLFFLHIYKDHTCLLYLIFLCGHPNCYKDLLRLTEGYNCIALRGGSNSL